MEEEGLEDISMLNRYSFGGENARRADLEALDRAQDMERRNVAMDTIFRETGWFQGTDGKWRFEIDDSGMEYDPTAISGRRIQAMGHGGPGGGQGGPVRKYH
mgnify:CR=1 FL=1